MVSTPNFGRRFGPGTPQGVESGSALDSLFNNPVWSNEDGITATASGTALNSYPLSATVSRVSTVASGNDGVLLPPSVAGAMYFLINGAAANTLKLFASGSDTINGTAGATGVSVTAGVAVTLFCPAVGTWSMTSGVNGGAGSFTTLTASGATTLNGNVEIGDAITDTVGFYGVAGITQRTSASAAAVGATASTTTTPWGFATSTQADSIVTLVNELRASLVALGAIKGS